MRDSAGQLIAFSAQVKFNDTAAGGLAHDDDDDDDYGLALKTLPGGKLCALCADGTRVAVKPCHVTVTDRSYLKRGMFVTSASDPDDGQVGAITAVATELHLLNPRTGQRWTALAGDTRRVDRGLRLYDYVVSSSGQWLGLVVELTLDVDVSFDDGAAVCRVTDAGKKLRTVDYNEIDEGVFFVGQRVVAADRDSVVSVFKASRWLKGYWKPSHTKGTVAKRKESGVLVLWLASSEGGTRFDQESAPPAYRRHPHNLTVCPTIVYNHWSLSNRCCFFPDDDPTTTTTPTTSTRRRRRRRRRADDRRRRAAESSSHQLCVVTSTRTTADVVWQDGTRQHGVPSTSVLPYFFTVWGEHEFLPGCRVTCSVVPAAAAWTADNDDDDAAEPAATRRLGMVRSFNHEDKTARVSWLNHEGRAVDDDEEAISAYYLDPTTDDDRDGYWFFYGYTVVRLRRPTTKISTEEPAEQQRNNKLQDLSWVGHVVDLCDPPYVQVEWGDGHVSNVLPHEIAAVNAYELDVSQMIEDMGDWVSDNDDDAAVDDDDAQAEAELQDPPAAIDDNQGDDDDSDGHSDDGDDEDAPAAAAATARTTTGWARAVAQAMIRLAGSVLARSKRYIVGGSTAAATENTEEETRPAPAESHTEEDTDTEEEAGAATAPESGVVGGDGSARLGKTTTEADTVAAGRFPNFDVVLSPPDHHYLDNMEGTGGGRKWIKRVQKEWKILREDNLPDTIYVRAFEDRMDLFRVVMVGASGTPYHDGLFFFDLQLPPSYPAAPPLVCYRSFGLRLNPNLYESGTVCLSLLNTFDGEGAELWSPEASSVLQVVVSIQGLVLTALPYYNEAGYEALVGETDGRRNELPYSENTYLLCLQTMMHLLRRPPAGFEAFVRDHFRRRGRRVLRACEAYMGGCTVATLDCEARPTERSRERPSSAGFRLALGDVVPRLVQVFKEIGADDGPSSSSE